MEEDESRPTVACLRCRNQKLRCGRELPDCHRCVKQKAICSYPSPPDRKRIAAQNLRRSKAASLSDADVAQNDETPHPPACPPPTTHKRRHMSSGLPDDIEGSAERSIELPSTELGLLLLEVYFKRIYNSKLMFDKELVLKLYLQGTLPGYLCRAIFAQAAIFMQPVGSQHGSRLKLMPLPAVFERSWCWARGASQEVLSLADEPTLPRIQALQVLQLYYFSRDELQRATVHSTLAYRLNQLLGYDKLYDWVDDKRPYQERYDRESQRRCFWASWVTFYIGSIPVDSTRVCERVAELPLPAWPERGRSVLPGPTMDMKWIMHASNGNELVTGSSPWSLMAELVRLQGIWAKVQKFIEDSSTSSTTQREARLNELLLLFDPVAWSLQLPVTDIRSRAEAYNESPELFTCVCSTYYISRLLLHSSMVPILSGCSIEFPASKDSVLRNAEAVLEQANLLAGLLKQFLRDDLDISMLWPFSGYACFLAGSVLMQFTGMMQSSKTQRTSVHVPGPGSEELEAFKTVLDVLSIFWTPLRSLAARLHAAIDSGQRIEASYITTPLTKRPAYTFEEHGNTVDSKNQSHPILSVDFANVGLEDQQADVSGMCTSSANAQSVFAQPPMLPQPAMTASNIFQPPSIFDLQPESSLEDFLMNSNETSFLEGRWTTSILANSAQGAMPMNQMHPP